MSLLVFWIVIAFKRILNLVKSSPVKVIWVLIIAAVFIYAFVNNHIVLILDFQKSLLVSLFAVLYSLSCSFKNYRVMPYLIKYSKSKYSNNEIYKKYFLTQAIKNNFMLFVLCIVSYCSLTDKKFFFIIPGITVFLVIVSFLIMFTRSKYLNNNAKSAGKKRLKINPYIKSTFIDYFNSDFFVTSAICVAVFLFFTYSFIKYNDVLYNLEVQFIIITAAFSIGFIGIFDSISNINWKFQAIVSPNDYKYHIKRTVFFLGVIFGLFLIMFIITGSMIKFDLLLKYAYCLLILLAATINVAFIFTGKLLKLLLIMPSIIAITIWISTLPAVFLPVLLIPVVLTFMKAKNEYREWFAL